MARKAGSRGFGNIRKLPSGRHQASYSDPDGRTYLSANGNPRPLRYAAPYTFDSRDDAEAWLADERRMISQGTWTPPPERAAQKLAQVATFGEYAAAWLPSRRVKGRPLAARTRDNYQALLDRHILPTFAALPLPSITPAMVERWHDVTAVGKPTTRAHAYSLLRTILASAVDDGRIATANPARIRGGGSTERVKIIRPASLDELEQIVTAMPERHQLLVLLAAWCALRFGELAELRRSDVDTKTGTLRIRRSVVTADADDLPEQLPAGHKLCGCRPGCIVKAPKSGAGSRDVSIPPHLMPAVRAHLLEHAAAGRDGLLFPTTDGSHLAHGTFYGRPSVFDESGKMRRLGWGWNEARRAAGRDDLRLHDLRHTGAVLAAQTGATLAELMARLGHSTPAAAMRYQHAAADRDREIARRLSELSKS